LKRQAYPLRRPPNQLLKGQHQKVVRPAVNVPVFVFRNGETAGDKKIKRGWLIGGPIPPSPSRQRQGNPVLSERLSVFEPLPEVFHGPPPTEVVPVRVECCTDYLPEVISHRLVDERLGIEYVQQLAISNGASEDGIPLNGLCLEAVAREHGDAVEEK
jgi:hypothetical protein